MTTTNAPGSVPLFTCLVYIAATSDGRVTARVANLAGIECTAADERSALAQLVPKFKQQVMELTQQNAEIPWLDPPLPPTADEQQRFIPVHL